MLMEIVPTKRETMIGAAESVLGILMLGRSIGNYDILRTLVHLTGKLPPKVGVLLGTHWKMSTAQFRNGIIIGYRCTYSNADENDYSNV